MIYDRLENSETYSAISERLAKGFRLLQTTDFSAIEPGKYEVDGKELFFMLQSYQSKELNDRPEAHKKYIDIQCTLKGQERVACLPIDKLTETKPYSDNDDAAFYTTAIKPIEMTIGDGYFAVLFPQDGHMPQLCMDEPRMVKKVVVKVQI